MVVLLLFSFSFAGCSKEKAAEIYDTAQFEELQNNREHALKLYQKIIEKYPGSEYARKAEERISQLKQK
jgi:outer membrane protein assembly factor BamD (BamD/ComL family)